MKQTLEQLRLEKHRLVLIFNESQPKKLCAICEKTTIKSLCMQTISSIFKGRVNIRYAHYSCWRRENIKYMNLKTLILFMKTETETDEVNNNENKIRARTRR